MKTKHAFFTKLTFVWLIGVAVALWMQWLSGDPAYPKFPPGPVLFIAVAGMIVMGARLVVDAADWRVDRAAGYLWLVSSGWPQRFCA